MKFSIASVFCFILFFGGIALFIAGIPVQACGILYGFAFIWLGLVSATIGGIYTVPRLKELFTKKNDTKLKEE